MTTNSRNVGKALRSSARARPGTNRSVLTSAPTRETEDIDDEKLQKKPRKEQKAPPGQEGGEREHEQGGSGKEKLKKTATG